MKQNVDAVTLPSLDVPEPQMGNQLVEVLQKIDTRTSHQVIEVPKIFPDRVPQRLVESRPPQMAEQLVEVPTNPGYALAVVASKLFSRREIREILSGVPQGRGGGGARGGLQGSRAGQNSTAYLEQIDENPVPQVREGGGACGGLQSSLPEQNSAAVVEQIVDIPARRRLPDFLPGQGSSSSSRRLLDDADEDFTWFFRTFPRSKKSAKLGSHSGSELPPESSPSTRRAYEDRNAPRVMWSRLCDHAAAVPAVPRRLRGLWVSSSWTQLLTCPLLCMSGWSMFPSCSPLSSRLSQCPRSLLTGSPSVLS